MDDATNRVEGHGHAAEPVGRVRVAPDTPEATTAEDSEAAAEGVGWTGRRILLGLAALLVMIAALLVILWGVFLSAGGDSSSRLSPALMGIAGGVRLARPRLSPPAA